MGDRKICPIKNLRLGIYWLVHFLQSVEFYSLPKKHHTKGERFKLHLTSKRLIFRGKTPQL